MTHGSLKGTRDEPVASRTHMLVYRSSLKSVFQVKHCLRITCMYALGRVEVESSERPSPAHASAGAGEGEGESEGEGDR